MDDFEVACKGLCRALSIREKYMELALQRFPQTASQYLREIDGEKWKPDDHVQPGRKQTNLVLRIEYSVTFSCLEVCSLYSGAF